MTTAKDLTPIQFNANLWMDSYGNTYHIVRLWVNGESYTSDYTYGYGSHYTQTALEMLQALGLREKTDKYLPSGISENTHDWWKEMREDHITHSSREVKRKKDMKFF